ncbi:hypothetical protein D3C86_1925240 [compost metagenome]
MVSVNAQHRSEPNIENPRIPAPRAENILRSFITAGVSRMSMGKRPAPVKWLTIRTSVFCCRAAVILSRKIRDTACPVVPEEVMVFTTSSSGTLLSVSVLNSDTGKNGISSGC